MATCVVELKVELVPEPPLVLVELFEITPAPPPPITIG
jgi:hypothetical protein